jgi:hypothetical protein
MLIIGSVLGNGTDNRTTTASGLSDPAKVKSAVNNANAGTSLIL